MANKNAEYAYSWLVNHGLTRAGAAGVVGNLMAESGLDPHAVGDGGTSFGIAQWHEGRGDAMKQFVAAHGGKNDLDTQLGFLFHELKSGYGGLLDHLSSTHNVGEAAAAWMKQYERPADTSPSAVAGRVDLAQQVAGNKVIDTPGGGGGMAGKSWQDKHSKNEYGFNAAFLDAHPDIAKLVDKAFNQQWTPSRFQAELMDTQWYQNHTDAQQRWQVINAEKPAQAAKLVFDQKNDLATQAAGMGIQLSQGQLEHLATRAIATGMTSQEVLSVLASNFDMTPGNNKNGKVDPLTGTAGETVTQLEQMAKSYGITVGNRTLEGQVQDVLSGASDVEKMRQYYIQQASNMYPTLAEQLKSGSTVQGMLQSYQDMAAKELGQPIDAMDPTDPKWTKALTNGANGLMTADEWLQTLRSDTQYGFDKSNSARGAAAGLMTDLAKMFGGAA